MKYIYIFLLGCSLLLPGIVSADVIIKVEVDPPVQAGDVARVSFYGSSNTGQQITGLNLPVDIGPVGNNMPSELSFLGAVGTNEADSPSVESELGGVPGGLNTNATFLSLNNTDAIVNVTGFSPVTLTTNPEETLLFELLLQSDSAAGTGSFLVNVNNGDQQNNGFSFNVFDGAGQEIDASEVTINAGSVNITAIPEPTALAICGLLGIASLTYRRRLAA